MKKTVITLAIMAVSGTAMYAQTANTRQQATATEQAPDLNAGKFSFKEESFNFGDVPEGPDVSHDFEFTNTGKKPIFIRNASAGCGCTVAEWPHEPVLPGSSAKIHVTFHSAGRPGAVNKVVFIDSDAQQASMRLMITGNVKPKRTGTQPTAEVKH